MRNIHTICRTVLLLLLALFVGNAAHAQDSDPPDRAPQFVGTTEDWINSKPLKISDLRGKVVLVDFWEYTCVNCIRTLPYLKEWNKRYAKDGLVIIGIHTPEFEFAKDRKNVAQAVKKLGITWPVLVDSDYKNWQAYNNSYWPRKYFIDASGKIVANHAGEGGYDQSEAIIQELLKQIHPNITFPKPMAPVRDTDKPGAVCYPTTREMYVGQRGELTSQHGNIYPYEIGQTVTFKDLGGAYEDGKIYAQGPWKMEAESLRHGRTTTDIATDYVALRYHALECNAVIKPEGDKPFAVFIFQDGKPLSKTDAGADIQYNDKGQSYIQVDEPRMYRLTKNAKFGSHDLKMATLSPDFGLYSFTFSSCEIK
ncbi:MAG TPA: redoxin domain-containing protein [Chthonomonadaceae bacterium]|nr:redoxin domain-containing protein [Chthonomonadaceae bacterium]